MSCQLKNYTCTFAAGVTAGVTGELFTLAQSGKISTEKMAAPEFRDAIFISGVQQIAKQFSKETLKRNASMANLAVKNPLIFGACTGLPMWALTKFVSVPLANSRKQGKKPFDGYKSAVVNDVAYHTIKNGIDEFCAARVFPKVLPKCPNFATAKVVEAAIAGAVGGGCYVLAWPYKTALTGQTLPQAVALMNKNIPKVAIKKATYTLARPQYVKLLK